MTNKRKSFAPVELDLYLLDGYVNVCVCVSFKWCWNEMKSQCFADKTNFAGSTVDESIEWFSKATKLILWTDNLMLFSSLFHYGFRWWFRTKRIWVRELRRKTEMKSEKERDRESERKKTWSPIVCLWYFMRCDHFAWVFRFLLFLSLRCFRSTKVFAFDLHIFKEDRITWVRCLFYCCALLLCAVSIVSFTRDTRKCRYTRRQMNVAQLSL